MKIKLEKILEELSHDTLAFMADSNHARGSIMPDQIPKVVGRLNSVLRKLSVRFTLTEKRIKVRISKGVRYYPLTVNAPYIIQDPTEPFEGDVARILSVETANGKMHGLNDVAAHNSILLRDEGRSFSTDEHVFEGIAEVVYKATTPQFDPVNADQEQTIDVPESLLNALYIGVAAITYQGIGGPENIAISNGLWAQYENECNTAKLNSAVEVVEFEESNRLRDKGFR